MASGPPSGLRAAPDAAPSRTAWRASHTISSVCTNTSWAARPALACSQCELYHLGGIYQGQHDPRVGLKCEAHTWVAGDQRVESPDQHPRLSPEVLHAFRQHAHQRRVQSNSATVSLLLVHAVAGATIDSC